MSKITKTIASTIIAGGAILGLGYRSSLAQSGDYYLLRARHSGQCLNVYNGGLNNADNVVQGEECRSSNFQWRITPAGNGYYYLQARHSGQCLNVYNGGQNNGDNAVQGEECKSSNFQWKIIPAGNNANYIQARHSGQCLNVYNSGQNNGDNVVQGEECNTPNFQWTIESAANLQPSQSDYYRWRNRTLPNRDLQHGGRRERQIPSNWRKW